MIYTGGHIGIIQKFAHGAYAAEASLLCSQHTFIHYTSLCLTAESDRQWFI